MYRKLFFFALCCILFWSKIDMFQYCVRTPARVREGTSIPNSELPKILRYSRLFSLRAKLDEKIPFSEYSKLGKQITEVNIEAPSMNTRRITASILIDSPMEKVWSILTDYNNLATHVPNLVKSNLIPSAPGTIRLFQEGAQKIIGFDFRASLTMDMTEDRGVGEIDPSSSWKIGFKLVESKMFDAFDGFWLLRYHSRRPEIDPITNQMVYKHQTKLTYSVFIRPRGPVPVFALEWRIREDVPVNLFALKVASEKLEAESIAGGSSGGNTGSTASLSSANRAMVVNRVKPEIRSSTTLPRAVIVPSGDGWFSDETLQSYIPSQQEETNEKVSYPKKIRVYEVDETSTSTSNPLMSVVSSFFGLNGTTAASYPRVRTS